MIAEMTTPRRKKIASRPRLNLTLSADVQQWLANAAEREDYSQSEIVRAGLWLLAVIGKTARRKAISTARVADPFGDIADGMQRFVLGEILAAAKDEAERARNGTQASRKGPNHGNGG